MKPLLLEGGEVDTRDADIERLTNRVAELEDELDVARAEAKRATQQASRAMGNLRRQLTPLYQALQMVFGELDAVGGGDEAAPSQVGNPKWDTIKARLAPRLRETVDLLLIQKSMRRKEIAAALRMDYTNCTKNVIGVLMRQGLLIENGQGVSLKEL